MNTWKTDCRICPRECGADRTASVGFCGVGAEPVVARAALHFWEEPCISGTRGAGAVFFAGCNLRCVYCQNYSISAERQGKTVSLERLREIFLDLIAQGAHNIDLVTPTHYTALLAELLEEALPVPVVWNSGGYDRVESLRLLENRVQVYMPDYKYADARLAADLSGAADYPAVAVEALREMFRQTGPYVMDSEGMLQSGLLIRHLLIPGQLDNTFSVLDSLAELFRPGDVLVSLMGQYTPNGHGGPGERVTTEEYERAVAYMKALGILDGYTQELCSAEESFVPDFDGTGV